MILLTKVYRLCDRVLLKKVVLFFDLLDEVFFKDGVKAIIFPTISSTPEYQSVDMIFALPARLMLLIAHSPLTTSWYVILVTQLALEDQFGVGTAQLKKLVSVTDLVVPDLSDVHFLFDRHLIHFLESAFLRALPDIVRIEADLKTDLPVRILRSTLDTSLKLLHKCRSDALVATQVARYH